MSHSQDNSSDVCHSEIDGESSAHLPSLFSHNIRNLSQSIPQAIASSCSVRFPESPLLYTESEKESKPNDKLNYSISERMKSKETTDIHSVDFNLFYEIPSPSSFSSEELEQNQSNLKLSVKGLRKNVSSKEPPKDDLEQRKAPPMPMISILAPSLTSIPATSFLSNDVPSSKMLEHIVREYILYHLPNAMHIPERLSYKLLYNAMIPHYWVRLGSSHINGRALCQNVFIWCAGSHRLILMIETWVDVFLGQVARNIVNELDLEMSAQRMLAIMKRAVMYYLVRSPFRFKENCFSTVANKLMANLMRTERVSSLWDKKKCRTDDDNQTLLTSLIVCGPTDVVLQGHVILSFPHCACLKKNSWNLAFLSSDKTGSEPANWQEHLVVGQSHLSPAIYPSHCHMDAHVCHLIISRLRSFCLIGETATGSSDGIPTSASSSGNTSDPSGSSPAGGPRGHVRDDPPSPACKTLLLVAFSHPASTGSRNLGTHQLRLHEFQICVRVLADTKDAFEHAVTMETRRGGRLLDTSRQLQFEDLAGENLCFSVVDVAEGWKPGTNSKYQEIPFTHIWKNSQSALYCAITLVRTDEEISDVSCQICVYQSNHYEDREMIRINSTVAQLDDVDPISEIHNVMPPMTHAMIPPQHVFRFSASCRRQISALLDSAYGSGNDWRMLARQYGLDSCIEFFESQASPTESLLNVWEATRREETAVIDLKKTLRAIGRSDVVAVILNSSLIS